MTLLARLCCGLLALGLWAGCGPGDGVFDIEVQPCSSPRSPSAFAVFYSIDDEPWSCYAEMCEEDSIDGCLIGAETPEVPAGSSIEFQVVLYESGQSAVACSQPIERKVDSDTTVVLPLLCDASSLNACPQPDDCSGQI